jgi:hypothetical protein
MGKVSSGVGGDGFWFGSADAIQIQCLSPAQVLVRKRWKSRRGRCTCQKGPNATCVHKSDGSRANEKLRSTPLRSARAWKQQQLKLSCDFFGSVARDA